MDRRVAGEVGVAEGGEEAMHAGEVEGGGTAALDAGAGGDARALVVPETRAECDDVDGFRRGG